MVRHITRKKTLLIVNLSLIYFVLLVLPGALTASAPQRSNLEVLDVEFEPIHQGKNVVYIKVHNHVNQDQVFSTHIYTRSPDYGKGMGWGTRFFKTIKGDETKWTRFVFKIQGPITDATWIRLKFHNPKSISDYDYDKYFHQIRYSSADIEHKKIETATQPASKAETEMVVNLFTKLQNYFKNKNYQDAWDLFTKDYKDAEVQYEELERFIQSIKPGTLHSAFRWDTNEFGELKFKEVSKKDGLLILTATRKEENWAITYDRVEGKLKIDWISGYVPQLILWADWDNRLLPQMQKKNTDHYDIYYFENSSAANDINIISEQKDKGYEAVCKFMGTKPEKRIRLILFEDEHTKWMQTGHQGKGWGYNDTIVEVYNQETKLDPYFMTTFHVTESYGSPPALLMYGFASYISEQLGAPPLKYKGGGNLSLYARVRELKDKGQWIDLDQLITYTDIGPAETQPAIAYAESGAFVKFLIDKYGKEKFLEAYKILKNSEDKKVQKQNVSTLGRIYGKSLTELENEWESVFLGRIER
ncbi:MAG: hypothetical protein JSV03_05640 [Planctomycetota bacterium]|nr:MAG: hypothetical protein JSV03_05640 [Planctomycetota bacterium]